MLGFYKERDFLPSGASLRFGSFEFEYTDNPNEFKSPDYVKSASILIKEEDDKTILIVNQEAEDMIDLSFAASLTNRILSKSTAVKTIESNIEEVLIPMKSGNTHHTYNIIKDNCFKHLKIYYKLAFYGCKFNPMKEYHYKRYKSDSTAEDFQDLYDKIMSMYDIILHQNEPLNIRERLINETIQLLSELDHDKLYITLATFKPFKDLAENDENMDEEKEKAIVKEVDDVMRDYKLFEKLFKVQDLLTEIAIRMKLSIEDIVAAATKVRVY